MSSYVTQAGDTFEAIARRVYGDDTMAGQIQQANPGAIEPFIGGITLFTPPEIAPVSAPITPASSSSGDPDEVILIVDKKQISFWTSITFDTVLDGISQINFTAPFTPSDLEQRKLFRPFSYRDVQISVGGVRVFSGTLVSTIPRVSPDGRTISASAYARAGVLQDCTMPASEYQMQRLEFNDVNLQDIATRLCQPFGLAAGFLSDPGPVFERVALSPGTSVFPFLARLSKQRGLLISNDAAGNLEFKAAIATGTPVAKLSADAAPVISVAPIFSPQAFYSHISGIKPALLGLTDPPYTRITSHLKGVLRPFTFTSVDALGGDLKTSVDAKAGRMFGDMIRYNVTVDTWRDPKGELWRANTLVVLTAPDAMVYSPFTFLIRSVVFRRTADTKTAVLNLVIPGSFGGEIPEAFPWD